jgi:hypothetical protein
MMIEIQGPELEALIQAWMRHGSFDSVEDALLQALRTAQLPLDRTRSRLRGGAEPTGLAIVSAFQASPFKEIDLEPMRFPMPVSLVEEGRRAGHIFSQPDLLIAATAVRHGLTVATRDQGDFSKTGVSLVNPWEPV